jgi:sigma-B regulation protein RsbU (phosphoserine phosphatase)
MKKPTTQYTILGVLLLWALIAQLTFSGVAIYTQLTSDRFTRLPFEVKDYTANIRFVPPPYRASGLQTGDDVIALGGRKVNGAIQLDEEHFQLHPGDKLVVTVERRVNGRTKSIDIPVVMQQEWRSIGWVFTLGVAVVLPIICLLVGFYIAFARPRDPLAWITMAMLASFGQLAGSRVSWAVWPPWRELTLVYHPLLSNTWPLWMLLFSLYFPIPFPFIRKHRWLAYALALPSAVLTVVELYGNFQEGNHIRSVAWVASFEQHTHTTATILFVIYVFGFFTFLGWKLAMLDSSDAKRRLRVMIAGSSLSLTPLLPLVFGQLGMIPRMPVWLVTICLLMLVFFPLTMAYVIVVQRAMDVRMVVRSGVQYAFASGGVKALQIALVILVIFLTIHFAQQSEHRVEGLAILATGIALVLIVGRIAAQTHKWMDRRFFREAYNAEIILTELSSSVAGIRDTKRLLETVTHRIADSLHVPRIAVLLESGGLYRPAYALGFNGFAPEVHFSKDAATVRTLKRLGSPSRIYFDDPQSWVHGTPDLEKSALQSLEAQVLLPVTLDSRLLGVISLGSKRSEVPYTKADLQLLNAVASQTGLALENAQLSESIRREIAQRERLDRELEIAREVQQRLFPQKLPQVKGLDFAGYCRPAQGVGGDYYDFIRLPNGCLGIAVGDVSGKGIAAALMMASLQASLRGQTIKPCETLSETIHHINRLVYDASADNRYATFFYAEYDPVKRGMRYVNAGHNPPLICRKRDNRHEFLRLEEGGTVVGLFPDYPYREGHIALESGDVFVAFTDGISEAMNKMEEEFDEERLMQALRLCPARSAADIITYILTEVDGFTAGANQHDDMTVVVVRLY